MSLNQFFKIIIMLTIAIAILVLNEVNFCLADGSIQMQDSAEQQHD